MFCDLVGSTAMSERLDPEDLRAVLGDYQRTCAAVITDLGGYVARYMGDGVLAYFCYPLGHEDDAERAVRAGLALIDAVKHSEAARHETLRVRVGIATGPVVVGDSVGVGDAEERAVLGVTPNLAARLQGLAEADQVVISPRTRRLVGPIFEYEDLGLHDVRGIREPVRAWRAVRLLGVRARHEVAPLSSSLVGRDEELQMLDKRWRHALEGQGHVALVCAVAGLGKSRLVRAFRDRLAAEPHTELSAFCSPHTTGTAFWPIVGQLEAALDFDDADSPQARTDKLAARLDALGRDLRCAALLAAFLGLPPRPQWPSLDEDPDVRRRKTIEAVVGLILAWSSETPLLFSLEDAHWADASTLELAETLVGRIDAQRVMVLITYRPEFESPWIGRSNVSLFALSRISRAETAAMVRGLEGGSTLDAALIDRIIDKADGVPLFVEELTRSVVESGGDASAIPDSLQDSLRARLDRLDSAKAIAQLAAAVGRTFPSSVLIAAATQPESEVRAGLDRLVEAQLVYPVGDRDEFEFKHSLIRDAAYQSLLRGARREHHARIAAVLETQHPQVTERAPERLARHHSAAGAPAKALPLWRAAAARASAAVANVEAAEHLDAALEELSRLPESAERDRAELSVCVDSVGLMRLLDRHEDALRRLDTAQPVAERLGDVAAQAAVHRMRGQIYFPIGRRSEGIAEQNRALELSRRLDDPSAIASALAGLADAHYAVGDMGQSYRTVTECVDLCREHEALASIEAGNRGSQSVNLWYFNALDAAREPAARGLALAQRLGLVRAEMIAEGAALGILALDGGRYEATLQHARRAAELSRRLGSGLWEWFAWMLEGEAMVLRGDARGIEHVRRAAAEVVEHVPIFSAPWTLGSLAFVTDDPTERDEALAEGERRLPGSVSHNEFWFPRRAIDACARAGQWDRVDYYASMLEALTQDRDGRPAALPLLDETHHADGPSYYVARARALARHGRSERSAELRAELESLESEASMCSMAFARAPLVDALADW
jgi:class 3 adenylate cyclase/tetratricopeptide (TPR) repeat protein